MKQTAKVLILIAVSSLVRPTFIPTAQGEDCVLKCMQAYQMVTGMTNDHKWELCQIRCKGQTSEPTYGAIAYSRKDKLWGFTYDQKEKATAEKLALEYCVKQGGAKCQIEASFHNTCGAIAAGGDIVTWGIAGSRTTAQQYAEIACSRAGGKQCEAQASVCSSPDSSGASDLKSASLLPPGSDPKSAPLPPRKVSWGAIAYSSKDMSAGWSQGKDDRASAVKEAMDVCAQRGKACVLWTAFNKQCGALAADREFAGWGTSTDQREALQKAIDECKKAGGTRCVPHVSFCSF
jgi:hypothetical protein